MPDETAVMKQRLQAVLASYGANPARWPTAERELLLAHLADAGDALNDARRIDRLLDLAATPALDKDFEKRLKARVTPRALPARFALGWSATLPLAAALALGIYLGAAGALDDLLPSAFTGDFAGLDDGDEGDISGATEATDYSEGQLS